jgi:hypothetical protein
MAVRALTGMHEGLHIRSLRDVCPHKQRLPASLSDHLDSLFAFGDPSGCEYHLRSFASKTETRGASNARTATRDQSYLARHHSRHRFSPYL